MRLTKTYVFLHYFSKFVGILLFVLKYMYISLLLKMKNVFSRPAKIMASPFNISLRLDQFNYFIYDLFDFLIIIILLAKISWTTLSLGMVSVTYDL